jgi:uncharacterized protein (DUF885 family)
MAASGESAVTALADDYWAYHRSSAQLWNIDRGDVEQIEHWEDLSANGVDERIRRLREFERRAGSVAGDGVTERERTMVAAVAFSAQSEAATLPYARDLGLVAGPMNLAAFLTVMVPAYGLSNARDGRGYITKLRSFPSFVDGWIDGLRSGVAAGRVATARGVVAAIEELDAMLVVAPTDDALVQQRAPTEMSGDEAARWRADVVDAVRADVRPAMTRLRAALHDDVLPAARPDNRAGVCFVPGGEEDYQAILRAATSTELSSDEIHELGREHLARLDEEYRTLGESALGIDDPAAVRARLRDDAALRYGSTDAVLADATAALGRAREEAPRWFTRMPSAPCAAIAVKAGGLAYYTGPSPDGGRGGTCHFNVSDPSMWTGANLEATTFHESIPGHHLQVALASELDVHPVLGELEVTSYEEGWGLYAERLADEMALYTGPLQRLGMLTLDSLRAARLVVDTGVHARGWSRDEAIELLADTTSLLGPTIEAEVDRYIAVPGQATSYLVGRLELQRLRHHAHARLAARFSLPAFHDTILGNGMMPLPALARTVDAWIESVLHPEPPGDGLVS